MPKLKLHVNSAYAILYALVGALIVLISTRYEPFGFGWVAWSALAVLAILVLWREVFETEAKGSEYRTLFARHANKLTFAVIFAFGMWLTSAGSALTLYLALSFVAGVCVMEMLAERLIHNGRRTDVDQTTPASGDTDTPP
jgi:Na+/melibiose symporter-like transporter